MNRKREIAIVGLLVTASLLVPQMPSVVAQAASSQGGSTTEGPHSIWWSSSVWNNRIPGDTIRYLFFVYNADPANGTMTISSLSLQTPWGNYSASGLPATLCDRCRYAWAQYLTIPSSQQPGNVTFYTRLTGTYGSGARICPSTGNVCVDATPVTIVANSSSLQQTVNTYSMLYLPLGIAIPSIIAIILLVLYARKP